MPENPKHDLARQGEALPPLVSQQLPRAPLGIPLLAIIRNSWDERQFESYTAVEQALSQHLAVLTSQVELKGQLMETQARWQGRASRIDKIRDIAAAEVDEELDSVQRRARLNAKREDIEIARLELELKAVRKASDDLDLPQTPPKAAPTMGDALAATLEQVREIEVAVDNYIADQVQRAGGEEQVSDELRQHIDSLRMVKAHKIANIYESMT